MKQSGFSNLAYHLYKRLCAGVAKGTDPALVKKVRDALLSLKPSDIVEVEGEQLKVMKAAWIDGYEELLD